MAKWARSLIDYALWQSDGSDNHGNVLVGTNASLLSWMNLIKWFTSGWPPFLKLYFLKKPATQILDQIPYPCHRPRLSRVIVLLNDIAPFTGQIVQDGLQGWNGTHVLVVCFFFFFFLHYFFQLSIRISQMCTCKTLIKKSLYTK